MNFLRKVIANRRSGLRFEHAVSAALLCRQMNKLLGRNDE